MSGEESRDSDDDMPPRKRVAKSGVGGGKSKATIKVSSMHRTVDRVKNRIRHMDPNLYCVLLLAKMKNGKLQVASNYPEVGSQFITSELALRFANCTNEGNVFKDQNAAAAAAANTQAAGAPIPEVFEKISTEMALKLVEKNRQQLKFAQRKLEDSLQLLKHSLGHVE